MLVEIAGDSHISRQIKSIVDASHFQNYICCFFL